MILPKLKKSRPKRAPATPGAPAPQHTAAMTLGARCLECPLYNRHQGPVMGTVRPGAKLLIVGESPSTREVEDGEILNGPTGELLDTALADGGVSRNDCAVTQAVLCRPPGGNMLGFLSDFRKAQRKLPKTAPRQLLPEDACYPRLQAELAANASRTVLALGNLSLRAVSRYFRVPFDKAKAEPGEARCSAVSKQHGAPVDVPEGPYGPATIMASLHPGFTLGGKPELGPVIRADMKRAAEISLRDGLKLWTEPTFYLDPTFDMAMGLMAAFKASGALLTIDIETDGINPWTANVRCIGLGAVIDGQEVVTVIPLLRMYTGHPWWSVSQQQQIEAALRDLLDTAPLSGHNLIFDTGVLLCRGLMRDRLKLWFDTMIGDHDSDWSELPHDLGSVVTRYFDCKRWKEDADAKVVKGVSDYWLALYCAKDVLGEMRLVAPVAARVQATGQLGAYTTDIQMASVVRDMGLLGLNVNEKTRIELFHRFELAAQAKLVELRQLTGNPHFNPNASRQVSSFLFDKQGLTPLYAAGDLEWSKLVELNDEEDLELDLDDPETVVARAMTNEVALLALLERGVDPLSCQFIDTQLMFRAMKKTHTALGLKAEDDGSITDTYRAKGALRTVSHGSLGRLSILHPSWKLHVTPTGRLASTPAVQNISERVVYDVLRYQQTDGKDGIANLRHIFEAPPGYSYVGADYSQIELRLVVAKSRNKLLLDALARGLDPHALNYASMMAKKASEVEGWYQRVQKADAKVRKHFRNIAKRLAFLIYYRGHKAKLARVMKSDRNPDGTLSFPGLEESQVHFWFDNFHAQNPEILVWQDKTIADWMRDGFVETIIDGRRRFFIGGLDEQAIPNMTIQGSAAAIVNKALLAINKECPHRGWSDMSGLAFQCHDELVAQVLNEDVPRAEELLNRVMPYTDPIDGMYYGIEQTTRKTLAGG